MLQEYEEIEANELWHRVYSDIVHESNEYKFTNKEAKKLENRTLNRYRDVMPFDHTRVKLVRGDDDYINASLITVEVADRAYILTQGPLPHTIGHFWLMIWEQKTRAILMLNGLIERGSVKCHQYWPNSQKGNPPFPEHVIASLEELKLKVELVSEDEKKHYAVREILLTDLESNESRTVTQFHYTAWPDFGLPESPSSFLEFLHVVRDANVLNLSKYGPAVVHCSAGIGRSGTLCLVDTCLVLIEKLGNSAKVDVKQILLDMRKYRKGLIQTPEQLRFSYLAIIEGAKSLGNKEVPLDRDRPIFAKKRPSVSEPIESDVFSENGKVNGDFPTPKLELSNPKYRRSASSVENIEERGPDESVPSATVNSPAAGGDTSSSSLGSPINNNLGTTELRRRAREERNRKTTEAIQRIKDKQKECEERSSPSSKRRKSDSELSIRS